MTVRINRLFIIENIIFRAYDPVTTSALQLGGMVTSVCSR